MVPMREVWAKEVSQAAAQLQLANPEGHQSGAEVGPESTSEADVCGSNWGWLSQSLRSPLYEVRAAVLKSLLRHPEGGTRI